MKNNNQEIWTKFCFLDESGSLNNPKDNFFTVGFIKCSQPYYLQKKIKYERRKRGFFDEIHFNKISKKSFDFYKLSIDLFFSTRSTFFCSYSLDKQGEYFNRNFGDNPWKAYESISIRLIESNIAPNEILVIIADDITTPSNVKFEINVKRKVNEKSDRLAVAGVCRFDSKSNDLLQIADLFVGMISYDLKIATGIISKGDKYKKRLLEYFKEKINISSLKNGYKKQYKESFLNIFVDKDIQKRL